ncbi:beta-1,3-galactosyltransferase 5-like isoform X2 [Choristoneura fumiferana]
MVTSDVGNDKLRSAHRRAMPKELLDSMNVIRIFLLAKIPPHEKSIEQNVIEEESRTFGDILQGSFWEHYRYLPIKALMGLQWAAINYDKASYIVKVDDDTAFSLEGTFKLLTNMKVKGDFFMGYILNNTEPVRDNRTKWYVSREEYAKDEFPPYLSGGFYVTTPNTARRVIKEAKNHPYFFLEDLFVTGFMTQVLNIKLIQLPKGFWLHYYELLKCCIDDMIFKRIMCDAIVGLPPDDGENDLIVTFNDAIRSCQNCSARTKEEALDKVCEAYVKVKHTLGEKYY